MLVLRDLLQYLPSTRHADHSISTGAASWGCEWQAEPHLPYKKVSRLPAQVKLSTVIFLLRANHREMLS